VQSKHCEAANFEARSRHADYVLLISGAGGRKCESPRWYARTRAIPFSTSSLACCQCGAGAFKSAWLFHQLRKGPLCGQRFSRRAQDERRDNNGVSPPLRGTTNNTCSRTSVDQIAIDQVTSTAFHVIKYMGTDYSFPAEMRKFSILNEKKTTVRNGCSADKNVHHICHFIGRTMQQNQIPALRMFSILNLK
jgi:hypothetical protein